MSQKIVQIQKQKEVLRLRGIASLEINNFSNIPSISALQTILRFPINDAQLPDVYLQILLQYFSSQFFTPEPTVTQVDPQLFQAYKLFLNYFHTNVGEQQNRNYLNSLKRVSTPLKETDRIYQVLTANHDRDDVLNFGLTIAILLKILV